MTQTGIERPLIVSPSTWRAERLRLLEQEKELTRQRDRINEARRRLPMVEFTKPYHFDGPRRDARLLDLFEGRQQLIVYHFMWLWEHGEPRDRGCVSCSMWADQIARGHLAYLHARDTTFALVSRAPLDRIEAFRARMGWRTPWWSSARSDFNFDLQVSFDETTDPLVYNYRTKIEHERSGTGYYLDDEPPFDRPGISCFLRDGERVFHTYSTYARGGESVGGAWYYLDLTALGRQEAWEEPKGRATPRGAPAGSAKIRYPDEFPPV